MKMRPLAAIDLPAGQPVTLKPGASHIMLRGLNQRLMLLQRSFLPKGAERIGDTRTLRLAYAAWTVLYDVDEGAQTIVILAIRR